MLIESSLCKLYRNIYNLHYNDHGWQRVYFIAYYVLCFSYIFRGVITIYCLYAGHPLWIAGPFMEIFSPILMNNNIWLEISLWILTNICFILHYFVHFKLPIYLKEDAHIYYHAMNALNSY